MAGTSDTLRELLQQFVDAKIDAPLLFARAADQFGPATDATEALLEVLAEQELGLELPQGRTALVRRFEQVATGETSYTELDLWLFTLLQVPEVQSSQPSPDPEVELLRTVVQWSQGWDEDADRPTAEQFQTMTSILKQQTDPAAALDQLALLLEDSDS